MAGHRRDRKISRRDFWSAGRRIDEKTVSTANRLSRPQKFSPRQTAQDRPLKLSRRTPRSLFSTVEAVAKHFCHDTITAKKVDLKTMRLLLRARLCVDAADVFFRLRIGPSSSLHG
jgi:hypothetical protein